MVTPVRPRVGFTVAASVLVSAMDQSPFRGGDDATVVPMGQRDSYDRPLRILAVGSTRRGAQGAGGAEKAGNRPPGRPGYRLKAARIDGARRASPRSRSMPSISSVARTRD